MSEQKPNIVFLVNDHQAFYRHGWDGGLIPARPHFEGLAKEGVLFDRAYSVCPLCTPARRSLMTGLFPHNHGFRTLDRSENTPENDEGILFDLLAEQNYDLFYYGKWHAGPGTAHDFGCQGFSYPGFGNPYITPEYKQYIDDRKLDRASFNLEHVFLEPVSPDKPSPGPGYHCEASNLHPHVTGVMDTPPDTHESFFLANLACEKLQELAAGDHDKPFFLRVDFFGPHAPYVASPEYLAMYPPQGIQEYGSYRDDLEDKPVVYMKEWNEPLGQDYRLVLPSVFPWSEWQKILRYVYAQITQVDAAGGKILDKLDRLGLAENTIVVWTTDHGDPVAAHGGHFGKEAFLSEEVLRVPLAVRWPSRITPGQTSGQLISTVDLPVTLLDAAGTSFRGPVDGRSLLELFGNGRMRADSWRRSLMCATHGHHGEKVEGRAIITRRHHYAAYKLNEAPGYFRENDQQRSDREIYDLQVDPYQLHNLIGSDSEASDLAEAELEGWLKQTGDSFRL